MVSVVQMRRMRHPKGPAANLPAMETHTGRALRTQLTRKHS